MGSGFSKMKKQAKALQDQMAEMEEKMKNMEVSGSSGGNMVSVVIDGEKKIKKIKINPECVDKDDIEGLEDLITAAINHAHQKLEKDNPMPKMPFPM